MQLFLLKPQEDMWDVYCFSTLPIDGNHEFEIITGSNGPILTIWKQYAVFEGDCITDQFRRYPIENPFWIPYGYVTENW